MLKMEKVKEHAIFISKLVHENKARSKDLLKNSTDEEIVILIELILNFETINEHRCAKNIKKDLNTLKKIKWNLKTARNTFIKNINHLKPVLSVIVILLLELEICEII